MPDDADWVLLVECYTMVELHTLRASLEARGVPCRVHGEHTHGVLGAIHGAGARSRVLVPRRALGVARALAEDIVGPFDERPELEDDASDASPFRTAAEDHEGPEPLDDGDAAGEPDEPTPADEAGPLARPKTYLALGAVLVLMLASVPAAGVAHLYVHRNLRGGILLVLCLLSAAATYAGVPWASLLFSILWVLDLAGGALGIAEHNRRLLVLPPARAPRGRPPAARSMAARAPRGQRGSGRTPMPGRAAPGRIAHARVAPRAGGRCYTGPRCRARS